MGRNDSGRIMKYPKKHISIRAIPAQWLDSLQNCRPEAGHPRVRHPRPECFWPVDVLELAELLILTKP